MKSDIISASELQIGDWLSADGKLVTVTSLSCLGGDVIGAMVPIMSFETMYADNVVALSNGAKPISKLKRIPLTREILEQYGFSGDTYSTLDLGDGKRFEYYHYENRLRLIWHGVDEWDNHSEKDETMWRCTCRYVHEFQHVLKACGYSDLSKNVFLI